ncbi:MAG: M48 family metalloprotease [Sphingomonas bacterium]|nr:M48 family metalloprotease [Sphingomonas bacterium]
MLRPIFMLAASATVLLPFAVQAQVRNLNQREVVEAQRQHPELVKEYGGAEVGARAAYVEGVGRRVAAYSGIANPGQTYRFTTLNSAVENAFAVPGGYIYITRQLMTLMDDESELAFVLGHETGHIAANHAQARRSAATRNSILGVLGAVIGNVLGSSTFGNFLSQGAQLRTLSFSRDQEYQADTLGTRYVVAAGYDPLGGAKILASLGRADALQLRIQGKGNRSTPEWASTHPNSQNRVQREQQLAVQSGRAGKGLRNRDVFLAQIEGLTVDDDPAQGVIEGRSFTHPDLKLQFVVPVGYLMQNSASAVSIEGPAGKAQFSGGGYSGSLENYIGQVIAQLTGGRQQIAMAQARRTTINGLEALYNTGRAMTSSGGIDVSVIAYRWDRDTVYHFVMLTQAGSGIGQFSTMVDSLRRLTAQAAAAIRPRVIDVVTVQRGDTVQSLAERMAYGNFKLDRFRSLNGLAANASLAPGQKVKIVIYGSR